ncbi:FG-GAP repeat protein [Leptospira paudalimensis]|uniref:VCBS repeat-containing protein n=1 Tax=Leptospira paudalimensis TaxID=2950024 RepID=A0ABT3M7I4_9LEPT|nr:FG-GAP repeat protein [Leptospira paudalimensis]MCW7504350.1 VCBS repeat-containing protein [Leptospira paudalimensis]
MKLDNFLCPDKNLLKKYSPGIYLFLLPESRATISNLTNNSIVETGFVVGTAPPDVSFVNVGYDDAPPARVPVVNGSWSFPLPAKAVTNSFWTYGSLHTIYVQIPFEKSNTILVRKGTNKDTNGDGYPDLIVSAGPGSGSQGYAFIYRTNPTTKQLLTSQITSITDGQASGTYFGSNIGSGDFNGDGYADVLVGAQAYSGAAGRVYEFLSKGQQGIPTLDLNAGGSADAILDPVAGGGRFGTNIACMDVNLDGFDDGIFASPWNDNLFILKSQGFNGFVSQNTSSSIFTYQSTQPGDNFGNYAALGDVNGDGFNDLIVGEHQYASSTGRLFIFVSQQGVYTNEPQQFLYPPTTTSIACSAGGGCRFGSTFVLDYFNSDRCIDLAVGAYSFNSNQGIVHVYHSTCDPLNPFVMVPKSTLLGPPVISCSGGCNFGGTLASGDTNGDGLPDLLIGATGASSGIGDVYLVLNDLTNGFRNMDLSAGGSADSLFSGNTSVSNFSMGLEFLDTNADGLKDIVISEPTTTNRVYTFHSIRGRVPTNQNLNSSGVTSQTLIPPAGTFFGSAIAR